MNTHLNRREFLQAASTTALAAAAAGSCPASAAPAACGTGHTGYTRTRILRVFMGTNCSWPSPSVDVKTEKDRLQAEIDKVAGQEDIEYVGNEVVTDVVTLNKLMDQHKDTDGILAVQACLGTSHLINAMADSGRPTMIFATPYSGHEWCIVPDLMRMGKKIDAIPTSRFEDVITAIRPFRTIHRLKETKILLVHGSWTPNESYTNETKHKLGVVIQTLPPGRLMEAYEAVNADAAAADAERWIKHAVAVKEPSHEEILKSARFNLALQKVLNDEGAQAITINCLGLFSQKALPAYPCFGFARLNDIGKAGVCEADVLSALTQVIFLHLTGKPGFVTDPVFDTSNNTVIHAHCVAATKMDGPGGEASPYVIRSHLEDNKGAVLQVSMRIGQEITMAKLVGKDSRAPQTRPQLAASPIESYGVSNMLISTGQIIDAPNEERGCRTKITTKVRDARKMFEQWSHGLHRVIFYGNHLADVKRLGRFMDFNVLEEC